LPPGRVEPDAEGPPPLEARGAPAVDAVADASVGREPGPAPLEPPEPDRLVDDPAPGRITPEDWVRARPEPRPLPLPAEAPAIAAAAAGVSDPWRSPRASRRWRMVV
jgi:hypothetical protein